MVVTVVPKEHIVNVYAEDCDCANQSMFGAWRAPVLWLPSLHTCIKGQPQVQAAIAHNKLLPANLSNRLAMIPCLQAAEHGSTTSDQ
jgi:hypothetical protein